MSIVKQVEQNHYSFDKYVSKERWSSYYEQINNILGLKGVKTCLEIGSGDQTTANILKKYIEYNTLDLDKNLNPDFYGSIIENNIDKTFDCVCAFQVLEHIPFNDFEKNIKKMYDLSNKYVIISLPYTGLSFNFSFKPFFKKSLVFKLPHFFYKTYTFDGEHYWDLGYKLSRINNIKNILEKHFNIKKSYINGTNMYHYFIILEKK